MEALQRRTQNSHDKIFVDMQDWEGSVASLFQNTKKPEEGGRRNNEEKNASPNCRRARCAWKKLQF